MAAELLPGHAGRKAGAARLELDDLDRLVSCRVVAARIALGLVEFSEPPQAASVSPVAWSVKGEYVSPCMAPPIARPTKIVCVGLNYRDHAEEQGVPPPERPILFAKWPNSLIGPGDPIVIPEIAHQVDYEAELGVVIGSRVGGAAVENALEAVAGYLCLNDVSARDLQFSDQQWTRGKSPDTFCPVGPELVPASDVPDPQALGIRAVLNGRVMQESSTANMVFGVAELIAYITQAITLEPGDLIATGTPAGVGAFRDPPVFMQPGDEVTIEIDGLGALTNPVR
jgi:2-keto-4-pentenoate hydratase/2-oxohepta-3-ene-1,7-dioic acid hydratase in catechol pathway